MMIMMMMDVAGNGGGIIRCRNDSISNNNYNSQPYHSQGQKEKANIFPLISIEMSYLQL